MEGLEDNYSLNIKGCKQDLSGLDISVTFDYLPSSILQKKVKMKKGESNESKPTE